MAGWLDAWTMTKLWTVDISTHQSLPVAVWCCVASAWVCLAMVIPSNPNCVFFVWSEQHQRVARRHFSEWLKKGWRPNKNCGPIFLKSQLLGPGPWYLTAFLKEIGHADAWHGTWAWCFYLPGPQIAWHCGPHWLVFFLLERMFPVEVQYWGLPLGNLTVCYRKITIYSDCKASNSIIRRTK